MKALLVSLLILSVLGISALSFVAMYHGNSYGDTHCVAETAAGFDCPVNPLAFADFHLNLFKGFSSAYFGNFFNTYLALLSFLIFGLALGLLGHNSLNSGRLSYCRPVRFLESFTPLVERKTSDWISLHENSPAAQ